MNDNNKQPLTLKLRFSEFDDSWEIKNLGEITKVVMGQSPPSDSYNDIGLGKVLIQGNADIKNRRTFPRFWTTHNTKEAEIGDILMTVRAPVGFVARCMHNVCLGRGVCAIRSSKKADTNFIYYFLLGFEKKWIKFEQGSTFTAVNSKDISKLKINIPIIEEQQKIASFLINVDNWIENLEKQKASLEEYKKGMMQKIFSQEVRFRDENGDEYPEWEEKKLGEVGKVLSGLTYKPSDVEDDGLLVLRSSNVKNGLLSFYDNVHVNPDNIVFNKVFENDILICVRNGSKRLIGKNALIDKKTEGSAFGAFMAVYRSRYNKYFYHLFNSDYYKCQVHRNLGATINSINGSDLKQFHFPFPSEEEQEKISFFLSSIDKLTKSKNRQIINARKWKKGLLQQMFV